MLSKLWGLTIDSEMRLGGIKRRQMGRDVGHPSQTQGSLFADFNLWESALLPPAGSTNHREGRGAQHSRQARPGNSLEAAEDSAAARKMQSLYC